MFFSRMCQVFLYGDIVGVKSRESKQGLIFQLTLPLV